MNTERIAQWLSTTTVGSDVDRFELRRLAIQDVLQDLTRKHIILTAKLYLGYDTTRAELERFRAPFTKRDPFFIKKDNVHELRVLAGLILGECWERPSSSDQANVSALIVWAGLAIATRPLPNSEVADVLERFLRDSSIQARTLELVKPSDGNSPAEAIKGLRALHKKLQTAAATLRLGTYQDGLEQLISTVQSLQDSHEAIVRNQLILQEETNILWWHKRIQVSLESEQQPFRACFTYAQKLASLHEILPPLPSASELLRGILNEVSREPMSIANVIETIPRSERMTLIADQLPELAMLCPVLGHVAASLEVLDGDDYLSLIRKRFGSELPSMIPAEFASTLFYEFMLLRALKKNITGASNA